MAKGKETAPGIPDEIKPKKAVGLLSGGLDSTLAHRIVADQGYEVIALNIETPFCSCSKESKCSTTKDDLGENVNNRRMFVGKDYIEVVRKPKHGYGKHMNICIDCRLYMLGKAKEIMEKEDADFIFTGEVLDQRPMSQRRFTLNMIERESGLEGKLLRPLSAKHLRPTEAEKAGRIDREKLFDIIGRTRRRQMALADELGIQEYPSPAGGCMLTDENFSRLLREAFDHGDDSMKMMQLLKSGRHYRSKNGVRIVAGRTEKENKMIRALSGDTTTFVTVSGFSSTYAHIFGDAGEDEKLLAAQIAVRYSKAKNEESVEIKWWRGKANSEDFQVFTVSPVPDDEINRYKI